MSSKAGSSFCGYQVGPSRRAAEVVSVVSVQRVPDDDEAVDAEAQRHGAFHRAPQSVAGLADAEQLFAGGDGGLDRPAVRVAVHDGLGVAVGVGGEDRQDPVAGGVADQDGGAFVLPNAPYQIASPVAQRDLDGVGVAVAGQGDPVASRRLRRGRRGGRAGSP